MSTYDFTTFADAAREVRKERFLAGKKLSGVRRKPRTPGDLALLGVRARERMNAFPPAWDGESLTLPYFAPTPDDERGT